MKRVVLLAGGLGGARLAPSLARALGPDRLTVVANVGDDQDWMGLRVSPDVDSILYALAGLWHEGRGWGRRDETFVVRDTLAALGEETWFGVGDRDLALHLFRTRRLADGASPTEVVTEAIARLGVQGARLLPASDAICRTTIVLVDGRRLGFQEWYVREGARPEVARVEVAAGEPSAAVREALAAADVVILGPSNPVTSLGPILVLRGIVPAIRAVPRRLALSPVVARKPSEDPGIRHHSLARARVLAAEGKDDTPTSIASRFADVVDELWIDTADAAEVAAIRALGLRVETAALLDAEALARRLAEEVDVDSA